MRIASLAMAIFIACLITIITGCGGGGGSNDASSNSNTSPTATFTITPDTGTSSTVFAFDASGCTDAEDPASSLEVRWDWNNDGTWDTSYSTTKTVTHTFASTGTYTVKLEV